MQNFAIKIKGDYLSLEFGTIGVTGVKPSQIYNKHKHYKKDYKADTRNYESDISDYKLNRTTTSVQMYKMYMYIAHYFWLVNFFLFQ